MDASLQLALIAGTIFFLAGTVKGVTGMGLPTVAMGLLGTLLSPVAAAALLIVPSFVTNVWQLFAGPSLRPVVLRLWPMMAAIALGTIGGSSLIAGSRLPGSTATSALGGILALYALTTLLLRAPPVPRAMEWWLSPLTGLVTGIVTGATGIFVIPAVPYLQSLALDRDDLVQALGLSFTVSTVALAAGLAWHGALDAGNLGTSALAVVPALAGMWAGQSIRARIEPAAFRRWFLICLLALGAEMLLRPLF